MALPESYVYPGFTDNSASISAVKTEITNELAATPTLTAQQIADNINAKTVTATVNVPIGNVLNLLLETGDWPQIEKLAATGTFSATAQTAPTAADEALSAAISLVRMVEANLVVFMTNSTVATQVQNALTALLNNKTIAAQSTVAAVAALASQAVSWLSTLGWPSNTVFAANDVALIEAA